MTSGQKVARAARLKVHDAMAHLHYGLANYGLPARKPVLDAILTVTIGQDDRLGAALAGRDRDMVRGNLKHGSGLLIGV